MGYPLLAIPHYPNPLHIILFIIFYTLSLTLYLVGPKSHYLIFFQLQQCYLVAIYWSWDPLQYPKTLYIQPFTTNQPWRERIREATEGWAPASAHNATLRRSERAGAIAVGPA